MGEDIVGFWVGHMHGVSRCLNIVSCASRQARHKLLASPAKRQTIINDNPQGRPLHQKWPISNEAIPTP